MILVVNCGSSSIKYGLYDGEKEISKGLVDSIGTKDSFLEFDGVEESIKVSDYHNGISLILQHLLHRHITSFKEIKAIGHRVVHGGRIFDPVLIDEKVKEVIRKNIGFAPLHNPANLEGIESCEKLLKCHQVAVFDTCIAKHLSPEQYTYALPHSLAEKHGIRRYGFHGISHRYVMERVTELIGSGRIITCHLGNGASMTAWVNGKAVETSMGMTPLEGLVMGTRSGDLDPAIVTFLMDHEGISTEEIYQLLNKKSGLLGISGISNDIRVLKKSREKRARLAIDVFCYRITKYIGAYAAAMSGLDAIAFTAGVGEHHPDIREKVLRNLEFIGVMIERKRNWRNQEIISATDSKVKVFVIHTDEELMIARECRRLILKKNRHKDQCNYRH